MILGALTGAWQWFTRNPIVMWIAGIGIAILGIRVVGHMIHEDGRKDERLKNAVKVANERADVAETQTQIAEEREDDRRRADEAVADLPVFSGIDELRSRRPDLHAIIFREAGIRGGKTEGR